jgi:hypothetical protein
VATKRNDHEVVMTWSRIVFGFVALNALGGLLLSWLLDGWLWPRYFKKHPTDDEKAKERDWILTFFVGIVERTFYILALHLGASQSIGFWLGIKVAIRWPSKSEAPSGSSDNIWIIGTGLSVLLSFLGTYIAFGQLALTAAK